MSTSETEKKEKGPGLLNKKVSLKLGPIIMVVLFLAGMLSGAMIIYETTDPINLPLSENPYITSMVGFVNSTEPDANKYRTVLVIPMADGESTTILNTVIHVGEQLQEGEMVELFRQVNPINLPLIPNNPQLVLMRENGEIIKIWGEL